MFHDIRFPLDIAIKASGGPERRTDVVTLASGREERNQRWAHSRRKYDVGSAVRDLAGLHEVLAFFEERRGRLGSFRFRDRLDWKSCPPGQSVTPQDQVIGTGDGTTRTFQLTKRYGGAHLPYDRVIRLPVAGTVRISVNGTERAEGVVWSVDALTGLVTFAAGEAPAAGAVVRAGFVFDVPVRFDTDFLDVDFEAFEAGAIPKIPLIEIVP